MNFGVAPPPPEVRIAFIPIPEEQITILARQLGQKLNQPLPPIPANVARNIRPSDVVESPTLVCKLELAGYPPLHAEIRRFGQTAMLAQWIHRMTVEVDTGRRGGVMQAVSLYLTGLDRAADNCAIDSARRLRFPDNKSLPVPTGTYENLIGEHRPLAVQIFVQSFARIDPSIRCAFLALGAALFTSLGVEEEPGAETL